ncbi:hypothetical protein P2G88_02870 [Aliiglaciecola sp. CAU 1673]|uniref:hypothetical protein n=1 Tax=Aliiglaciecola sp. CAU 1673 TaxID=3032595 RepID=UPI0023DA14DF|nr:hypothetical protein [Aliiglaciecola sp. CAU 1673]MDF2177186.1 hypothetical protein [Aliiglaciecola sp. CAU 1673]
MAKRNRNTLKQFFQEGAMPGSQAFSDLIDSSLNTLEDGLDKSPEWGYKITALGNHDHLLSFYRDSLQELPNWSVRFDGKATDLQIGQDSHQDPLLFLSAEQKLGINTKQPRSTLDVKGVVSMTGRQGYQTPGIRQVPADGKWHPITGTLNGCQGFEVVAGTGNKGTGRYALMYATALNTFNPTGWLFNFLNLKKCIKVHQAYFLSRSCKLALRWKTLEKGYCLEIRSRTNLGDNIRIGYHLTHLWFDEDMTTCWQSENKDEN